MFFFPFIFLKSFMLSALVSVSSIYSASTLHPVWQGRPVFCGMWTSTCPLGERPSPVAGLGALVDNHLTDGNVRVSALLRPPHAWATQALVL